MQYFTMYFLCGKNNNVSAVHRGINIKTTRDRRGKKQFVTLISCNYLYITCVKIIIVSIITKHEKILAELNSEVVSALVLCCSKHPNPVSY